MCTAGLQKLQNLNLQALSKVLVLYVEAIPLQPRMDVDFLGSYVSVNFIARSLNSFSVHKFIKQKYSSWASVWFEASWNHGKV